MAVIEEVPTQDAPTTTQPTSPESAAILDRLRAAEELKAEGNDHFRGKEWTEALVAYKNALAKLPKRRGKSAKGKERATSDVEGDEEGPSASPPAEKDESGRESSDAEDGVDSDGEGEEELHGAVEGDTDPVPEELQPECAKARAVLNANIGACYVKLDDHKGAVASCTEALADDPAYVKALQRRASSNEAINTWASLSSASEDYAALLKIVPEHTPLYTEIERAHRRVKPRLEAAQKEELAEMMSKLKGVGNSVLGYFGLSTDNFKFEPNGQGGYSVNFSQ